MTTRTNYLRVLAMLAATALVGVLVSHNNPASAQGTTSVDGTTITVNTKEDESTDDGNCSLREAIEAADTNTAVDKCKAGSATERDAIHFSLGKKATIVLGSQLPTITDPSGLNINGLRAKITISGNDAVRVFEVGSRAKLTLANLTVTRGLAAGNCPNGPGFGGGIENNGGTLTVTRSTFSANNTNPCGFGGGIANNDGKLTVINSTFSDNKAGTAGGGILNSGELEVSYSTFSGNASFVGGGINNANTPTAIVTLSNTILANNKGGNIHNPCAAGNCQGTITDGGYNISDDASFKFTDPTSKNDTDPLLDPNGLQNNGGPTQTIALQKGSPAIDAIPEGANGCGTEVTTDQRGVKRPQGPGCDIEAFERKKK